MNLTLLLSNDDILSYFISNHVDLRSMFKLNVNKTFKHVIFSDRWWTKTFGNTNTMGLSISTMYKLLLIDRFKGEYNGPGFKFRICRFGPVGYSGPTRVGQSPVHRYQKIIDKFEYKSFSVYSNVKNAIKDNCTSQQKECCLL